MVLSGQHLLPVLPEYFAENLLRNVLVMRMLWVDPDDL
jgi:hypothetical protein